MTMHHSRPQATAMRGTLVRPSLLLLAALAMLLCFSNAALAQPELFVIKTVTTEDGECQFDADDYLEVNAGDTVKYCYEVINFGNETAFDVGLHDDNGTFFLFFDDFFPDLQGLSDIDGEGDAGDLGAGEAATAEYLVEMPDPNFIANIATASGVVEGGEGEVTADDDAVVLVIGNGGGGEGGSFDVTKSVTTPDGDCGEAGEFLALPAPGFVKYCYEVVNNSDEEPIFFIEAIDDNGTPEDFSDDFMVELDLTDEDDDGEDNDLAGGETAYGEAVVALNTLGTVTNIVNVLGETEMGEVEGSSSASVCVGLGTGIRATTGDIDVQQYATINVTDTCDCIYSAVFTEGGDLVAAGSVNVDENANFGGNVTEGNPTDPTPLPVPDGISLSGNLEVRANETVVLEAGDYYFDNVFIKDNSRLETEGPVRIWFRGRLEVGGNAPIVPLDNLSENLMFFSTDDSNFVEVKSNASLIGSIIAPNVSNIQVQSNADVYGILVGASVVVRDNANFHQDLALCDGCPEPTDSPEPFPMVANAVEASLSDAYVGQFALIDSWNSCNGFYGGINIGANGAVQAAFDITLHEDAIVNGELFPNTESIHSSQEIPEGLESSGTLFINSNETVTLPAGDYLFDDVFLNSNADLITGPGLTRIWFTGRLEIGSNAHAVAASGIPADLWFFSAGCGPNDVLINESSSGPNLIGVVFAPELPTLILSNSQIYGAIVGSDVEVRPNANIHYDEGLLGCDGGDDPDDPDDPGDDTGQ